MSISRYDQRFNKLSRYVPFIVNDEEQNKMKFLKGLRPYFTRFLISSGASTYREVMSKALALEQNDVEDRKSKDLRGQERQDQRPDKGKAVQTQYDSLGSKRQRFEGTLDRVMGGQYFERAQLASRQCWNCGETGHVKQHCLKPARGPQTLRQFQSPVGYQPRPQQTQQFPQ
ncbi:hypothetical protein GIB67_017502 [Kingdonia uniflora]|uniref:CCHC-type domain-containing protein n=1 Tax=Kingdonia uniflora TaxID=39325 RepID=A0A7J7M4G2_9MAGN|nr:hypothetical protein GIB67_017502 [Kingdonia uniflora]